MHYASFWKDLQVVAGLEKLAAHEDRATAQEAQVLLAGLSDRLFSAVKQAGVVDQLLAFREAHRVTGEKLASEPKPAAEFLQKLATAAFVDDVISRQLEKLSGAEYDAARAVQLLGREYAVHLMRGLFA